MAFSLRAWYHVEAPKTVNMPIKVCVFVVQRQSSTDKIYYYNALYAEYSDMTRNSQPKRINDTSPVLSQRQLVNPSRLFNIPVASKKSSNASSSNS